LKSLVAGARFELATFGL